MRPRLLDGFCGAGGAGAGYARAGFVVVGVDNRPQPRYPFEFIQADFFEYVAEHGHEYNVIHASPPCHRYTRAQNAAKNADAHPDLVSRVRELLRDTGAIYVIEKVVGAPLENAITLCGLAFGLQVKRHRLFESNVFLLAPPCPPHTVDYYVIFGHEVRNRRHGKAAGRKNKVAKGREAMGIPWMSRDELSEAIPPAYTFCIGEQLMQHLKGEQLETTPNSHIPHTPWSPDPRA